MTDESREYRERILVVDDESGIRDILQRFLERRGYQVSVASGGEEALQKIEREGPDVVLLDVIMPGMSGVETLNRIREMDESVGVIMVTAVGDEKIGNWTLEHGADDYITKPIDFDYLEMALLVKITMLARDVA